MQCVSLYYKPYSICIEYSHTHTHMYYIDDRLTLHMLFSSQVYWVILSVCWLLINFAMVLELF